MKTTNVFCCLKILIFIFLMNVLLLTNVFGINPKREYAAKPDAIGLKYESYKIKVSDAVTLNSWVCLQSDLTKPFIIISGPDAGNMANSLGQAKALYDSGYNVILYDYRGFGESSDFKMDPKAVYYNEFAEDLNSTIAFVKTKFKPKSMVLYGLSMGTIISRKNLESDSLIKGLILDSFVLDPKLVVDRIEVLKKKVVVVPANSAEYAASNRMDLKKPVLIFSGLKDKITMTDDYKDFLAKNKAAKMITWNCNHIECFTAMGTDPNFYMVEVDKFVGKL